MGEEAFKQKVFTVFWCFGGWVWFEVVLFCFVCPWLFLAHVWLTKQNFYAGQRDLILLLFAQDFDLFDLRANFSKHLSSYFLFRLSIF